MTRTSPFVPVSLLVTLYFRPSSGGRHLWPSTHAVSEMHRLPASGSKEHSMLMRSPAHGQ